MSMEEAPKHFDSLPQASRTPSPEVRRSQVDTRANVMKTVKTVIWAGVFAVSAWYLFKGMFIPH